MSKKRKPVDDDGCASSHGAKLTKLKNESESDQIAGVSNARLEAEIIALLTKRGYEKSC
jgi:hypothetical protein